MRELRYDTVLFDLDHTLLDSDASHAAAFDATMSSIGIDDPSSVFEVFDRINQALWRRVERHELSPNEVKALRFRQFLDEMGLDGDPTEMGAVFVDGLTQNGELYPGAQELVEQLAGLVALGMVTNGIGRVQRDRLARLGIADCFHAVIISGEVGTNKPGAEIFDLTFEALGIAERSRAVMIGDNLGSDIQGGINAGIETIWFNPTGSVNSTGIQPTHEVTTLDELPSLLA